MKILRKKKTIAELVCLVFGIVLSIVGLYFFHQQYLCYTYTPLLFILGVVVCLGSSLISLAISIAKDENKKVKTKRALITALVVALALLGLMVIINLIFE